MSKTTLNGISVPMDQLQKFQTAVRRCLHEGRIITDTETELESPEHCYKIHQNDKMPPIYVYNTVSKVPTVYEQTEYSGDSSALTGYVVTSKLLYRVCRGIINTLAKEPNHVRKAAVVASRISDEITNNL